MSNSQNIPPSGDANGDFKKGGRKIASEKPKYGASGRTDEDFAWLFRRHCDPCDFPVVFQKAGSALKRRVVVPPTGATFEGRKKEVLTAIREHYASLYWECDIEIAEWDTEPCVVSAYTQFAANEIVNHVRDNWDTPEPDED